MHPTKLKNLLTWVFAAGIPLIAWVIPGSWYPIAGLTVIEQRIIAIFALAALFWILEPVPIYATSIIVIALLLFTCSTSALTWMRGPAEDAAFGKLLDYKEIMATFASPIILLFLGGFFMAAAATKYRMDQNLARVLLKPFGNKPGMVMLGLMIITAFFSMFMSNTATTAMMLSILAPLMSRLDITDRGRIALTLSIPVAANLGGVGTPIGTPPNAIALQYLTGQASISFGQWMVFGIPFVVIMLFLGWLLLLKLFPFQKPVLEVDIKGKFLQTRPARVVYLTFVVTILLWLTDFIHGMNAYTVAILPVAVFLATGIINKEDMKRLSWDVLWLVAGGIAIGLALEKSGLAQHLIKSIPFEVLSPISILILASVVGLAMANFMSNTATANLLLPLMAALGTVIPELSEGGGLPVLILSVTFAISMGMCLPISTPPNALAHATGNIQSGDMARTGLILGIAGLVLAIALMSVLKMMHYFA